jgi:hypothetical protein
MVITIPLYTGVNLMIACQPAQANGYPTAQLQKGMVLVVDGLDLAEEGVGFGVSVLKRGLQTIFPGSVELTCSDQGSIQQVRARYRLNLVERLASPGRASLQSSPFYLLKDLLAWLIRWLIPLRSVLTGASSLLRWLFNWHTTYEESGFSAIVPVAYSVDCQAGQVWVEVDPTQLSGKGVTEIVVMNEQGANYFSHYGDSTGASLDQDEIGFWNRVTADWATFTSPSQRLIFTIPQAPGATLYRGRKLVGSRLAWAGFGYSFSPTLAKFAYALKIERLP